MTLELNKNLEHYLALKRSQFYFKADVQLEDSVLAGLKQQRQALRPFFVADVDRLCQAFFKQKMKEIVPLSSGGTFHLLYRVTDLKDKHYVVRLNLPEFGGIAYEFLIDQWIYGLLKKKKLPTLQVHVVDLSRTQFPFDYEIIDCAAGKQLNLLQDPETQYLSPSILESLGQFLAALHSIRVSRFGPFDISSLGKSVHHKVQGVHKTWRDYIFCNLDEHVAFCLNIRAIDEAQAERIIKLFQHLSPLLIIDKPVLLHGDLGNHNIFSDGKKVTALIDWEDCMAGDPYFDVAYWGTFYRDHYRSQLLEGYCQKSLLADDFEIRYWLYYLRISLSKTVHRYRFGYQDVPGRSPASSRIGRALDNFTQHGVCI